MLPLILDFRDFMTQARQQTIAAVLRNEPA